MQPCSWSGAYTHASPPALNRCLADLAALLILSDLRSSDLFGTQTCCLLIQKLGICIEHRNWGEASRYTAAAFVYPQPPSLFAWLALIALPILRNRWI